MGRMKSQPNAKGDVYFEWRHRHEGKDCSYGKEIGKAKNEEDARSASHLLDTIASYALFHLLIIWALGGWVSYHSNGERNVWWFQHLQFQLEGPSKFLLETTATSVPATCSSTSASLKPSSSNNESQQGCGRFYWRTKIHQLLTQLKNWQCREYDGWDAKWSISEDR